MASRNRRLPSRSTSCAHTQSGAEGSDALEWRDRLESSASKASCCEWKTSPAQLEHESGVSRLNGWRVGTQAGAVGTQAGARAHPSSSAVCQGLTRGGSSAGCGRFFGGLSE